MFRPSMLQATLLATLALPDRASAQAELIGLTSRGSGNLEVFVRGMDNAVWYKGTTGTWFTDRRRGWTNWESLGGRTEWAPGAAIFNGQRLLVAVMGMDLALWSNWGDRSVVIVVGINQYLMTPWISAGGTIKSSPSLCAQDRETFWAYVLGMDDAIWRKKWSPNNWGDWERVDDWGVGFTSGPAVVCSSFGFSGSKAGASSLATGAVFAARNGAIWQMSDPFGNAPVSLGVPPVGTRSAPAAAYNYLRGVFFVFVTGLDSAVWYRRGEAPTPQKDEWVGLKQADRRIKWDSSWISLGGVVTSAPAAAWIGDSAYAVAVAGKDGAVWLRETRDETHWTPWTSIGGRVPIPPRSRRVGVPRPRE